MSTFSTPLVKQKESSSNDRRGSQRRASGTPAGARFQPFPTTPSLSLSSLPPPIIQTVIYQQLPPRLKDGIPYISETLRIVVMRVGQDMNIDASLIRASLNGAILVVCIWQDARASEQFHCFYKTLNQQLVVVKLLLRNRPVIVVINAGVTRSKLCFHVTENTTYDRAKGGSAFNFGLQPYSRWIVPGWNPVCPDYLPDHFTGMDGWQEKIETDVIGKHVLHYAYPPRRLYPMSVCFPCCLCPQICIARMGNFYPIRERDLTLTTRKPEDAVKILEISSAKVEDTDFTIGGVLPAIEKEESTQVPVAYSSLSRAKEGESGAGGYTPPAATLYAASGSAMVPNPLATTPPSIKRRPAANTPVSSHKGRKGDVRQSEGAMSAGDEINDVQL